ncbi:MAG: GGDEF and EAL domain-containing protein [Oscillospiraceae bacterium]
MLFIGIAMSFILGKNITQPITKLVSQLKASNPNKKISLNKIGVTEIDELSNSIEELSDRVFDAQKRISQIIAMTEVPVGYFEYFKESEEVFCTESLADILGWDSLNHRDNYLAFNEFKSKMSLLAKYKISDEPCILNLENKKWLKLITFTEGDRIVGTLSDITRETLEKKHTEYERDYDVMTGTLNRTAFSQKAMELFHEGSDTLKTSAIIMADLDNLKYTNDNFGHEVGDLYIKTFANLLKDLNYKNGLVSRRSGDEFYILLYGFSSKEDVMEVINSFWHELEIAKVKISATVEIKVRASAGIAWYPDDSKDFGELLSYADFAMYTVKNSVKGTYRIFNMESYSENAVVYKGQEELNKLIENNLVRYAFQPIVRASDASIYGYEMLMRPVLPFFSNVTEVIRTAKYQNKMGEIERLTWYSALSTAFQKFDDNDIDKDIKVFINSIADQILKPDDVAYITEEYGDFLNRVVLEFTEDTRADTEYSNEKRKIVKKWKGMLAIDDFGSGYNNEKNLIDELPHIIKLDIILVRNIDSDKNRKSLVENMIRFAKDRGILVLSEGVETKEEMETLVNMGVDLMQGYYFGKPEFIPQKIEEEKILLVKEINKNKGV